MRKKSQVGGRVGLEVDSKKNSGVLDFAARRRLESLAHTCSFLTTMAVVTATAASVATGITMATVTIATVATPAVTTATIAWGRTLQPLLT